jgi:alpha-glucuronidase
MVHRYYDGAAAVSEMARTWDSLEAKIPTQPFHQIQMALDIQEKEAHWWRDACVLYFQSLSNRPIPNGLEKPQGNLQDYMSLQFPHAPGQGK